MSTHTRARVAALTRHNGVNAAETREATAEHAVSALEEFVARTVAQFPSSFSEEQRARIATLLRPFAQGAEPVEDGRRRSA